MALHCTASGRGAPPRRRRRGGRLWQGAKGSRLRSAWRPFPRHASFGPATGSALNARSACWASSTTARNAAQASPRRWPRSRSIRTRKPAPALALARARHDLELGDSRHGEEESASATAHPPRGLLQGEAKARCRQGPQQCRQALARPRLAARGPRPTARLARRSLTLDAVFYFKNFAAVP